ncbi:hypothetical protein VTN02DRAFT_4449 [Thermoascus thermophilus]
MTYACPNAVPLAGPEHVCATIQDAASGRTDSLLRRRPGAASDPARCPSLASIVRAAVPTASDRPCCPNRHRRRAFPSVACVASQVTSGARASPLPLRGPALSLGAGRVRSPSLSAKGFPPFGRGQRYKKASSPLGLVSLSRRPCLRIGSAVTHCWAPFDSHLVLLSPVCLPCPAPASPPGRLP